MISILDKIYAEFKNFSPTQRKIAEYLSNNLEEAIILNATQIAGKLKVSEASITRFVARLGLSGFSEFKRELGQYIVNSYSTADKLTESAETFETSDCIFPEILSDDIKNIKALSQDISKDLFNATVDSISSARSIYVIGFRSSYSLALYLAFNLRFFLNPVKLIKPEIWDIPEQILDSGKGDVLIAISFKRYTREVVKITEKIKKKGVYIVALTESKLSPIAQLSDIALIAKTKIPTYYESYAAPMSLINAIITAIALKEREKALPALNKLEREFQEFQIYVKSAKSN